MAGGSGSGKTTIARTLTDALAADQVALIEQDCYYRDQSHLQAHERAKVNFDHPEAIEHEACSRMHLDSAVQRRGNAIDKPRYDLRAATSAIRADRSRRAAARSSSSRGSWCWWPSALRERFASQGLFVDTDPDIRVIRRIRRDLEQRGRSFAQVRKQYYESVRPMHLAFVEPSKRHADVIIPEGGQNRIALDMILGGIREHLRKVDQNLTT